jgi:hypothetical protein
VRTSRVFALLCGVVAIGALAALIAVRGHGLQSGPVVTASGTVYIETNSAQPGGNAVLAFRYVEGVLSAAGVRSYPTGGSGSHDLSNSGVLDADQEVILNPDRTLLFAVNSGSDTIAVFHVLTDGSLTPVSGSPFPSGGAAPTSLGLSSSTLIVANKAQDGVRDLRRVPANYSSFHVNSDGSLSRPISSIDVPPRSSPLQTYITPDGKVMISSEETGVFRTFLIGSDGTLTQVAGSPFPLPASVNPSHNQVVYWPAGLESHPTQNILYAQIANLSLTIVYRWDDEGRLTFVRSLPNAGSFLPCWTHVNAQGTRMYSGNAGNDTISVFDISASPADPVELQSIHLDAPGNPWNFALDPSGRWVFMLDMRAVSQIPAGQGNDLHTLTIGGDGRLAEPHTSPVKIPVPVGDNPVGLVVAPG